MRLVAWSDHIRYVLVISLVNLSNQWTLKTCKSKVWNLLLNSVGILRVGIFHTHCDHIGASFFTTHLGHAYAQLFAQDEIIVLGNNYHDCENVGPQVTWHTLLYYLIHYIYISIQCRFDKIMILFMLKCATLCPCYMCIQACYASTSFIFLGGWLLIYHALCLFYPYIFVFLIGHKPKNNVPSQG